MKLGLIAYLTFVTATVDASPLRIVQTANEDLEAQIEGARAVRLDEVALEIDGKRLLAPWRISKSSRYARPVAVVVLFQGTEAWMGRLADELRVALDRYYFHPPLSGGAMAGEAHARIGVYAEDVRWLPAGMFLGSHLGLRREYLGHTRTALTEVIRQAATELRDRAPSSDRRVLVVVGDGCDEASPARRNEIRNFLEDEHVELHAVVYKTLSSCDGLPIQELGPTLASVTTVESLAATTHEIVSEADARTFLRFDSARLPWDGEFHQYTVIADGERFGSVFQALPDRRDHRWRGWWWVAFGGGLIAALALGVVIRRWHRSAAAILR